MDHILLLRSPSKGQDAYTSTLESAGFKTISIPVLQTDFTNTADLESIIKAGPLAAAFSGVIITSGRACEAWGNAVESLMYSRSASDSKITPATWDNVPFYAVGKGTASGLARLHSAYGSTGFAPVDIRGESTGTGENLAHFIVQDIHERPTNLLYLTGDKNQDTLPAILNDAGFQLRSIQVYQTQGSLTFNDDLAGVLRSVPRDIKQWWIVHFAPSAAAFATPILREHFNIPSQLSEHDRPANTPKIVAIGPTTTAYLTNQLQLTVDVTSSKPTPEGLLEAITSSRGH
ncbi:tetrapyrrole biosynthesis, uroporphyrinogen III synthase [Infundibulicybe gibba]|nr:tetrapyrrole biosynthesis, uroporphyrinogen III synthase [Infundibulicybe gibba]